jgi:hypothetical protein
MDLPSNTLRVFGLRDDFAGHCGWDDHHAVVVAHDKIIRMHRSSSALIDDCSQLAEPT